MLLDELLVKWNICAKRTVSLALTLLFCHKCSAEVDRYLFVILGPFNVFAEECTTEQSCRFDHKFRVKKCSKCLAALYTTLPPGGRKSILENSYFNLFNVHTSSHCHFEYIHRVFSYWVIISNLICCFNL